MSKYLVISMLLISLSGCSTRDSESSVVEPLFSREELIQDLDRLKQIISNTSPKAFTDFEKLSRTIDSHKSNIDEMSLYDFSKIVANVIAQLDCGHSAVDLHYSLPEHLERYFPLPVRAVGSDLYLFASSNDGRISAGSRIHAINGRDTQEIMEIIYSHMPSDGRIETSKEMLLNREFSLFYNKIIESPEVFALNVSAPGGTGREDVTIEPVNRPVQSILSPPLSNVINDDYAVLRIMNFNKGEVAGIVEPFFDQLAERGISNLIIDFRRNSGGDPYEGDFLLRYLLPEPYQYLAGDIPFQYLKLRSEKSPISENAFSGNLYVLIDGGCFSTTGHVLSLIKENSNAVIIGQESGGGFVCNGNPRPYRLSNSGIKVYISQGVFSTSATTLEKGRGIMPDIPIEYGIDDYLSKRDLEFEAALKLIAEVNSSGES